MENVRRRYKWTHKLLSYWTRTSALIGLTRVTFSLLAHLRPLWAETRKRKLWVLQVLTRHQWKWDFIFSFSLSSFFLPLLGLCFVFSAPGHSVSAGLFHWLYSNYVARTGRWSNRGMKRIERRQEDRKDSSFRIYSPLLLLVPLLPFIQPGFLSIKERKA